MSLGHPSSVFGSESIFGPTEMVLKIVLPFVLARRCSDKKRCRWSRVSPKWSATEPDVVIVIYKVLLLGKRE